MTDSNENSSRMFPYLKKYIWMQAVKAWPFGPYVTKKKLETGVYKQIR